MSTLLRCSIAASALLVSGVAAVLAFPAVDAVRGGATSPAATLATTSLGRPDCRISVLEPERLAGELRLEDGRPARRLHPAGAFRDGTVTARFVVPEQGAGRLSVGVGSGAFRGEVVGRPGRRALLTLRRDARPLATHVLPFRLTAGSRVEVALRESGRTLLAKAWPVGRRPPAWQLRARHRAAERGSGRASVGALLPTGSALVAFTDGRVRTTSRRGAVGVYDGMFEEELARRHFGSYPSVAASYYQPSQQVSFERERTRIRQGISPSITITTLGTNHIAALGSGPTHPDFPRAEAWLDQYVAELARLASLDVDVPVYATLEHEFKVKVATGAVTGPSADPRLYGRALRLFFAKARAASAALRVTYWIVADDHDRALEREVGLELDTPPDAILFDPYAFGARDTIASIVDADLAWIKRQPWYVGQEIALGEFGMPVSFGDRALQAFHTDVHRQLRAAGLSWGVFFNRSRDFDTQIAGRRDWRKFPRAVAAMNDSLATSNAC